MTRRLSVLFLFLVIGELSCAYRISRWRHDLSPYRKWPSSDRLHQSKELETERDSIIKSIKDALRTKPNDEPLLFNFAMLMAHGLNDADTDVSKLKDTLAAFEKAVSLNPKRSASWYYIAMIRQQLGDLRGSADAYRATIKVSEDVQVTSACYNNLIQLLLESDIRDLDEAAKVSDEAVNFNPNDDLAWTNMGIVLRENQSLDWAEKCFQNAVNLSGGQNAVAANNLGNIYWLQGRPDLAMSMYSKALAADSNDESSMYSLALLMRDSDDSRLRSQASELFQRCIELNPTNTNAKFQLAALSGDTTIDQCPSQYVTDLFDNYAKRGYDKHMVNDLQYRVPEYLWDAFISTSSSQGDVIPANPEGLVAIELGVGTGLVGSLFRSRLSQNISSSENVADFSGCDLSAEMITRAYELTFQPGAPQNQADTMSTTPSAVADVFDDVGVGGEGESVYTDLAIADCVEYLEDKHAAGAAKADFILAGDVLVYLGSLERLFKAAKSNLADGNGRFIFSVEKLDSSSEAAKQTGYTLRESARFAHSKEYIERTAAACGLRVAYSQDAPLRLDGKEPVMGYIIVLQNSS